MENSLCTSSLSAAKIAFWSMCQLLKWIGQPFPEDVQNVSEVPKNKGWIIFIAWTLNKKLSIKPFFTIFMTPDQQGDYQNFFYRKELAQFDIHYCGPNLWNDLVYYKTIQMASRHNK